VVALDVVAIDGSGRRLVDGLAVLAGAIVLVTLTVLEGEVPRLVGVLVEAELVDGHLAGAAAGDLVDEAHDADAEPQDVDGGDGEQRDAHTPDGLPLGVVRRRRVVADAVEAEVGARLAAGVEGKEVGAAGGVLGDDASGDSVVEATKHCFFLFFVCFRGRKTKTGFLFSFFFC
jgi:hypothetical protein